MDGFNGGGPNVLSSQMYTSLGMYTMRAGVSVYENTPMVAVEAGSPNRIRTASGEIIAREVVLATNIELARRPEVKAHVSVFSSFALMTEPAPARAHPGVVIDGEFRRSR